jgi:NAD+ kinase
MKKISSFGIVTFKKTPEVASALSAIQLWANQSSVHIFCHPFLRNFVPDTIHTCSCETEFIKRSDALLSLGGDGTFLSVAHMSKFTEKPIIGINLGGIGFLTDIDVCNIKDNLEKIHRGDYHIIKRMVIEASIIRDGTSYATLHALNDIFINRIDKPKLAMIAAWYGNDYIADFRSDGIIIATPSGSTAYSLSAGGPIVEQDLRAMILTPICPHSLTERPIVLSAEKAIRLFINTGNPKLVVSADGIDTIDLLSGDEIIVSYKGDSTNLIQLAERSYFEQLRTKLNWGVDCFKRRNSTDAS